MLFNGVLSSIYTFTTSIKITATTRGLNHKPITSSVIHVITMYMLLWIIHSMTDVHWPILVCLVKRDIRVKWRAFCYQFNFTILVLCAKRVHCTLYFLMHFWCKSWCAVYRNHLFKLHIFRTVESWKKYNYILDITYVVFL